MHLTPEERAAGKENFETAVGASLSMDRRQFILGAVAAGTAAGTGLGAMYFGYQKPTGNPVRVGVIGTGDEGGVLIGAHNPEYINITAIADIRPYNIHRAFHGDVSSENALAARPGLLAKYPEWKTRETAEKNVKIYGAYEELLEDASLEAVIIALPLHLHAEAAIKSMRKGKHVLTEKLMGHSVHECKEMGRVSKETGKLLATGHQRHYSILYDNAVSTIKSGLLGDVHHIRAQWHRGNLPGKDSWQQDVPEKGTDGKDRGLEKINDKLKKAQAELAKAKNAKEGDPIAKRIAQLEAQLRDATIDPVTYGYKKSTTLPGGYTYSALEELIRWRLFNRTGGGLMAELGSHQLDASGIFISAQQKPKQKALPLTVSAVGGRHIFPQDREVDDHVYCTYEFPGKGYFSENDREKGVADPNKKVVVTYSSINGNGFGDYGEVVMGTKATMILEKEQDYILVAGPTPDTKVGIGKASDGSPVLDTTESGGAAAAVGKLALEGPKSKGYTEEIEHWAWCIRNPSADNLPRCHPQVALGDAVIALTTNIAIERNKKLDTKSGEGGLIAFDPKWFEIDSDETPEGIKPDVNRERYKV